MWPAEKVTQALGIHFPIIQAPMAGVTTPELVAAVSNAGGLGSLGAGYMRAEDIKQSIKKIRVLTDKPFAVNLFIPGKYYATAEQTQQVCELIQQSCVELNIKINPVTEPYLSSFEEQLSVIVKERVPIFSFTFGIPDPSWIAHLKSNGIVLIGTATTLTEAHALEEQGIDMVVAQGSEAGGHRGTFLGPVENALINTQSLLSQIVNQIKIPIIAAGGIMNGQGIVDALRLGAQAVQLGTAFLSCPESGIHPAYKQALLTMDWDNTVLTRAFSGKLARGIKNKFIARMDAHQAHILDYPIQNALTRDMRKEADKQSNIDFMSLWAGQSARLSRGISAAQLMHQLVSEVEARFETK